jgi:hypothetical protein
MAGKGKSARGPGRGKALATSRETRKRKELASEHVEGQAPGEKQKEGTATPQEPGPSREGKRKRKTATVPDVPESSEYESDESNSEWQGTSKWQHNVPQSIETPDFVNLSVPPLSRSSCGGRLCRLGGFYAKRD